MNEDVERVLYSKDITPTAMRILVLEYLLKQSAAVGLKGLEHDFQHSDRTTLYRTLKTFEEFGLIHSVHDGIETKYALCADTCKSGNHYDLHLHFYCYTCLQTYCLPKHAVPAIKIPDTFELKELNLIARGICDRCGC